MLQKIYKATLQSKLNWPTTVKLLIFDMFRLKNQIDNIKYDWRIRHKIIMLYMKVKRFIHSMNSAVCDLSQLPWQEIYSKKHQI